MKSSLLNENLAGLVVCSRNAGVEWIYKTFKWINVEGAPSIYFILTQKVIGLLVLNFFVDICQVECEVVLHK